MSKQAHLSGNGTSEDKERFVRAFATALREKGVDAWVDEWEIRIGDSLIDKIYEEGLAKAEAVIIVLSSNSINKKWVREELDVATINRISGKCRIIPVILDKVDVPESLKHIKWYKVESISAIETVADHIVNAIFNIQNKPKLGQTPQYVSEEVKNKIEGLTLSDQVVFRTICEQALKEDDEFLNVNRFLTDLKEHDIPDSEIDDSLQILESEGLIKGTHSECCSRPLAVSITTYGFHQYFKAYSTEYDRQIEAVGAYIVNENKQTTSEIISSSLSLSPIMVRHVLNVFEQKDLIDQTKTGMGLSIVHGPRAGLKRMLNG
jgi:hypothetical protein